MASLWERLTGLADQPSAQPPDRSAALAALGPDPEGAGGYADVAGNSREARAAGGMITAPIGALDYMGRTLRGEEPLYDPRTGHPSDEAYGAAGTLAGVGMTGGIGAPVRTAAGEVALGAGPIRAYHGSPHDFDRFDLSKIGTGEGAQAYGHGLYFAENEGVARGYRNQLAHKAVDASTPEGTAYYALQHSGGDRDMAAASLVQRMDEMKRRGWLDEKSSALLSGAIDNIRAGGPRQPGHMYEVGIHADPERFLNWDKPLVEQPHVWAPLHDAGVTGIPRKPITPDDLAYLREKYGAWGEMQAAGLEPLLTRTGREVAPRSADAAQALREAGIPGIRYLDQGSRKTQFLLDGQDAKGTFPGDVVRDKFDTYGSLNGVINSLKADVQRGGYGSDFSREALDLLQSGRLKIEQAGGSSNYVVFSPEIIQILRKYGLLGPVAGGAAAGALAPQDAQPQQ